MEQDELLRRTVENLERLNLTYLVTGSMATILYGEPRFTNDIDIVVQMSPNRVGDFVQAFPSDEFYLDDERIRQAIERRGQFNVIHPASGLKIDVIIPEMDEFDRSRFATGSEARAGIGWWMSFYNQRRPHSSLKDRTPEETYTDRGAARRLGLRPASSQPEAA